VLNLEKSSQCHTGSPENAVEDGSAMLSGGPAYIADHTAMGDSPIAAAPGPADAGI
jgi:hypothetical protein